MRARVPQDVDLEDRLVYGLSPLRFVYLVIAALAALSLWRADVMSTWLRAMLCLLALAAAAALAWGRWHGRALDLWLLDLVVFGRRNYRIAPRRPREWETPLPLHAIRAISPHLDRD